MATKKKDVATVEDDKPAYLAALEAAGPEGTTDNFDSSDVAIPQIKLLQGTSDQVKLFDAANQGEFWHTGMDISLGTSIQFTICSRRKKYLLQAPLDDGQGILARADDAETWDRLGEWEIQVDKKTKVTWSIEDLNVEKSGLTKWGTYDPDDENSPPAATLFYDYLVVVKGYEELGPAVISLARSAVRKAKKGLNDKIQLHKNNGRPMQSLQMVAGIIVEQNDSNQDYFNWSFTQNGFSTEEQYNSAVAFGDALGDYAVKDEGQQDAPPPPAESDEY